MRETKPIDATVISVTQINAGEAINVIPDSCVMKGTVRTFSTGALDTIENGMRRICNQLPPAFNAHADFEFIRNYPPTINHATEAMFAADVAAEVVGESMVQRAVEPTMGAEDFAYMLLEKPGAYIFLGNGDVDGLHRARVTALDRARCTTPVTTLMTISFRSVRRSGSYWQSVT